MAAEIKNEIALEIAHVLFIDIVAYSKMATDEQRAAVDKLNQIVQATDEFRKAESEKRLLKIATGDGMALIFYHSPEDPVECALEISRAIKEQHSNLRLRMGVHSGPVSGVVDVNGRANVAGAGINTAQRVMDCADAGHILLSTRVAEDLEQFKHWRPHLYHIGECEVKHGEKIEIVNLFTAELGNSERPKRLTMPAQKTDFEPVRKERAPSRKPIFIIAASLPVAALAIAAFLFWQRHEPKTPAAALSIPEKSIAVLPFENLSDEKQNAFFTDGVQDEILTDLAKIADLKVISRTSVMQYKSGVARNLRKIGEELGVTHVVEGSVQRAATKTGLRQLNFWMKRSSAIPHFSTPTASSPLRTKTFMQYRGLITLPPGWRWLKLRCKPQHGCDRMLPKLIWRARNISTTGCATMPAPSPNWRSRGERCPMIRVSSYSPVTFCGGAANRRKVCRTCSAQYSWTRATLIFCNRSRSVTNSWGAMPTQSLQWIAR